MKNTIGVNAILITNEEIMSNVSYYTEEGLKKLRDELRQLKDIERLLKQLIIRKEMEGFAPKVVLPVSILNSKPIKAKRPKKPRSKAAPLRRPQKTSKRSERKPR